MPATRKRKGSPSLEETEDPAKRRFAENEDVPAADAPESQAEQPAAQPTPTLAEDAQPTPPANDRAARFAALRARNAASRKSNLAETKNEVHRSTVDPSQLTSLNRKKDIAQHKLLKAEIEETGADFVISFGGGSPVAGRE